MTKRILVMGLPGSGKTTLSQELVKRLMMSCTVAWFNADTVREQCNDWDFTPEGRLRQVRRMRALSDQSGAEFVVCDFVCPTAELRDIMEADIVIWMDTIKTGRFEDTNKVFQPPTQVNYHITSWESNNGIIKTIVNDLTKNKNGDSKSRSLLKAVSWRMTGTVDTLVLSLLITGEMKLAGTIAASEVITKIALFWLHERVWNKIKWGRSN